MSPPQTIVIENGVIKPPTRGRGCDVEIDGTGKYLIPGLIDSHVHIESVPILETLTSFGVTTGMSMACYDYETCAALTNVPGLASMFSATPPVSGIATQQSQIANGTASLRFDPADDPAEFIARGLNPGSPASFLKVVAQPAAAAGLTQENLNAFTQVAHDLGYYSVTHATYLETYAMAAQSKTDGIQHIPADGLLPADVIDQIVANGQFVTPTIAIFRVAINDPIVQVILRQGASAGEATFDVVIQNVRSLHLAGVPVLAGSDAAAIPAYNISMPFGLSLHCELEYLVDAGFTNAEALGAATSLPASIQNLHDRGVISPGKRADLILLDADPLVNISNTRNIDRVWVKGAEYSTVAKDLSTSCAALRLLHTA